MVTFIQFYTDDISFLDFIYGSSHAINAIFSLASSISSAPPPDTFFFVTFFCPDHNGFLEAEISRQPLLLFKKTEECRSKG